MAGFADAFSAQNVEQLMMDPRVQLGMQMLAQGGWQQGDPGFGQRLGQAGAGFMDQRAQTQLMQGRQQQLAQQQAQAQARQQLAEQLKNPDFAAQLTPHARRLAEAGADADTVFGIWKQESELEQLQRQHEDLQAHRNSQLGIQQQRADAYVAAQGRALQPGAPAGPRAPKTPTPRQLIEEPLPDGTFQKHMFDAATGGYKPYGAPFKRGAQGDSFLDQTLGAEQPSAPAPWAGLPTGPKAPIQGLPGTGGLESYAPNQQPLPMAGAGGGQAQQRQLRSPSTQQLPGAQQAGPARPQTKAEYDALPPGTRYLDPATGKVATKR